jgi:eukaryotic-like serine/threonine-protein kinase
MMAPASPITPCALSELGRNLLLQQKPAAAEPMLRESLALQVNSDAWTTFETRSLLGEALAVQKQYAVAEPFLVEGYEGLNQRITKIPADRKERLPEADDHVVRLYKAWGKLAQAKEWTSKLGLADLPGDVFAPGSGR